MVAAPTHTGDQPPDDYFPDDTTDFSEASAAENRWQPMTVEAAVELIPAEVSSALQQLLKGDFREVRRYSPSKAVETVDAADEVKAVGAEGEHPDEIDPNP